VLVLGLDGFDNRDEKNGEDRREGRQTEATGGGIDRAPNGLIEISVQRIVPQELDFQRGGSEERSQDP